VSYSGIRQWIQGIFGQNIYGYPLLPIIPPVEKYKFIIPQKPGPGSPIKYTV
jgi:hypothetical protein